MKPLNAASSTADPEPGVYTIKGSYSDKTWISSGQAPLAPQGLDVLGSIEVPGLTPSNSNLQFVEVLGAAPFDTGELHLGTTDPDTLARADGGAGLTPAKHQAARTAADLVDLRRPSRDLNTVHTTEHRLCHGNCCSEAARAERGDPTARLGRRDQAKNYSEN